jgi:hypothetical protein
MAFDFGNSGAASPVLASLGYGLGDRLADQVQGETEEERRRRLLRLQGRQELGAGSAVSPVAGSLFGAYGR